MTSAALRPTDAPTRGRRAGQRGTPLHDRRCMAPGPLCSKWPRTITPPELASLCRRACPSTRMAGGGSALSPHPLPRGRSKGPSLPPSPARGHSNLRASCCASPRGGRSRRGAGSGPPPHPIPALLRYSLR